MSTNTVTPTPTKNERLKSFSRPRTQGSTGSSKKNSRNSKYGKKRNQKNNKPLVALRGPVKEYVSSCCSALASKPRAGRKELAQDPESKKMKDVTKGLGHWRCTTCGKPTKVTPRVPLPKEVITVATPLTLAVDVTGAVNDPTAGD